MVLKNAGEKCTTLSLRFFPPPGTTAHPRDDHLWGLPAYSTQGRVSHGSGETGNIPDGMVRSLGMKNRLLFIAWFFAVCTAIMAGEVAVKCSWCSGTGIRFDKPCTFCNGTGTRWEKAPSATPGVGSSKDARPSTKDEAVKCSWCSGTGVRFNKPCTFCNGTGTKWERVSGPAPSGVSGAGQKEEATPCTWCSGKGIRFDKPCTFCNGTGKAWTKR